MSKKEQQVVSLYHDWETFLEPQTPPAKRILAGKKLRESCPRKTQGIWEPPAKRSDPVELLLSQHSVRLEKLLPYRYGRMAASPLAFLRGAALVMASDLSHTASSGIQAQLCGDCHLSNFGVFATPERNIIFDLNDFDETHPGPWEWDIKRLAASFAVAATELGFSRTIAEQSVAALASTYREHMERFAYMRAIDVWYDRIDWEQVLKQVEKVGRREAALLAYKTWRKNRTHEGALDKLTELVEGRRRIKDNPPLITHPEELTRQVMHDLLIKYLKSLPDYRRQLLLRYRFVDVAMKVVGIGSVGTRCGIVLLQGEGEGDDPLFLQIKQANASVLEPYVGKSEFSHYGERIVAGQRLLQAASDLFLGWTTGPKGAHFYVRQLMDIKGSIRIDELDAASLCQYARLCGRALARAHARSGDPALIFGYLGSSESFDEALTNFATAYAKQTEEDHDRLLKAIKQGRIEVAYLEKPNNASEKNGKTRKQEEVAKSGTANNGNDKGI